MVLMLVAESQMRQLLLVLHMEMRMLVLMMKRRMLNVHHLIWVVVVFSSSLKSLKRQRIAATEYHTEAEKEESTREVALENVFATGRRSVASMRRMMVCCRHLAFGSFQLSASHPIDG